MPHAHAVRRRGPTDDVVADPLHLRHHGRAERRDAHVQHAARRRCALYVARFGLGANDMMLMASPLAHQTGFHLRACMMPIHLGGKRGAAGHLERERARWNHRGGGGHLHHGRDAVPVRSDAMKRSSGRRTCASLRTFLSAGAPIPRTLVRRATGTPGRQYHLCLGHDGKRRGDHHADRRSAGKDLRHRRLRGGQGWKSALSMRHGAVLPPDAEGRLQARGSCQFRRLSEASRMVSPPMPMAGSTPAIWRASIATATCELPAVPRTSSSAAAKISP